MMVFLVSEMGFDARGARWAITGKNFQALLHGSGTDLGFPVDYDSRDLTAWEIWARCYGLRAFEYLTNHGVILVLGPAEARNAAELANWAHLDADDETWAVLATALPARDANHLNDLRNAYLFSHDRT